MDDPRIDQLDPFAYRRAMHYALNVFQMRSMGAEKKDKGFTFEGVGPDWDHDPEFVSVIPKK